MPSSDLPDTSHKFTQLTPNSDGSATTTHGTLNPMFQTTYELPSSEESVSPLLENKVSEMLFNSLTSYQSSTFAHHPVQGTPLVPQPGVMPLNTPALTQHSFSQSPEIVGGINMHGIYHLPVPPIEQQVYRAHQSLGLAINFDDADVEDANALDAMAETDPLAHPALEHMFADDTFMTADLSHTLGIPVDEDVNDDEISMFLNLDCSPQSPPQTPPSKGDVSLRKSPVRQKLKTTKGAAQSKALRKAKSFTTTRPVVTLRDISAGPRFSFEDCASEFPVSDVYSFRDESLLFMPESTMSKKKLSSKLSKALLKPLLRRSKTTTNLCLLVAVLKNMESGISSFQIDLKANLSKDRL